MLPPAAAALPDLLLVCCLSSLTCLLLKCYFALICCCASAHLPDFAAGLLAAWPVCAALMPPAAAPVIPNFAARRGMPLL